GDALQRIRLGECRLDDPITRYMRQDFAVLRADQTVAQAIESLRAQQLQSRIIYLYVLDDQGKLQGVVPTRRLLLSPPDRRISDIMVTNVVTIPAQATLLDACEFFVLYRYLAFPVVDEQGRMLGVVDIELYSEERVELEQRWDDLFQLVGVHLAAARQTEPWQAFRARFPWLTCNIVGGFLAALLSGVFASEISRVVALALFVPVVLSLAEAVSMQSVSLILQLLHLRSVSWRLLINRLLGEAQTGILLGVTAGLVVATGALIWPGQWSVAATILGGIALGVILAACLGVAVPTLLRLFHLDPRVAAGPVALTLTDLGTLLAYFSIARTMLAS
ncbi:MAG: CBS domain-containing protein, partial [Gemmatales bacterium]|nr:CBS domain-containing protein [Gemmatales bacterium]MDW8175398.1 CBS domain-containing protein [Gemmatales bacterium]